MAKLTIGVDKHWDDTMKAMGRDGLLRRVALLTWGKD